MVIFYNVGRYQLGVVYFRDTQCLNKIESSSLKYESLLHTFLHIMFKVTKERTEPLPPIPNYSPSTQKATMCSSHFLLPMLYHIGVQSRQQILTERYLLCYRNYSVNKTHRNS